MAAIMEYKRYGYYNALNQSESAYPVERIFKMAKHPSTIFIQLKGLNPGWAVGQSISFRNSQTSFSGKIWYIWRGRLGDGTPVFNLYVKHSNPASVMAAPGGEVMLGSFAKKARAPADVVRLDYVIPPKVDPVAQPFDMGYMIPKITGGIDPVLNKPIPGSAGAPDMIKPQQASMAPSFLNTRNITIAGLILVAVVLLKKKKK